MSLGLASSASASACLGATQFKTHECVTKGDASCKWVSGSSNGETQRDAKINCLSYCAGIRKAAGCSSIPNLQNECGGNATCLKNASENAARAAQENGGLAENALSGIETSKEGQKLHLASATSQLEEIGKKVKSNPQSSNLASFQNDQKILQQVREDLNSNKIVSKEYASLAKNPGIRKDLEVIAMYSDSNEKFTTLATFHGEQEKKFNEIATKSVVAGKMLGTLEGNQVATKNENDAKPLSQNEKTEGKSSLSKEDIERLERALNKISSQSIRNKIRKDFMNRLKKKPGNSKEMLDQLDLEVEEISKKSESEIKESLVKDILIEAEKSQSFENLDVSGESKKMAQKIKELSEQNDANAGILSAESRSLFVRIHEAHVACAIKRCVEID